MGFEFYNSLLVEIAEGGVFLQCLFLQVMEAPHQMCLKNRSVMSKSMQEKRLDLINYPKRWGFPFTEYCCCTQVGTAKVLQGWKDWTVTSPLPRGCQVGGSFHIPVKLSTEVIPIYLLTVTWFWTAGLAGATVCDGSSPHLAAATGSRTSTCWSLAQCPNLMSHCSSLDVFKGKLDSHYFGRDASARTVKWQQMMKAVSCHPNTILPFLYK